MNKEIIENIWSKIIPSGQGEFEYKLLSKESIPQLNIGFNKKMTLSQKVCKLKKLLL